MKKIVIAGSINMDIVTLLDQFPKAGETVLGRQISYIPGGKGANQVRAIKRLGGNVNFYGKVGNDDFGKALLESLRIDGLSTKNVKVSKSSSGVAVIDIDKSAQNRIIIIHGANFDLSPKDIEKIKFAGAEIAISQFEIPKNTIYTFFKKAKMANCPTILNPSPIERIPKDLAPLVDYLIVNQHEFAYLAKIKNPQMESSHLAEYTRKIVGKNQTVIVTFGEKGSVAIAGLNVIKVPGFRVKATDTTGAGDSFLGAFAQSLAEDRKLEDSLAFANAAAALKVTKFGASQMPYRQEVKKFLKKQKTNDFDSNY